MLIHYLTFKERKCFKSFLFRCILAFACLQVSVSSLRVNSQFYGHGETTHKISPLLLHATSFKFYLPLDVPRKSVHT